MKKPYEILIETLGLKPHPEGGAFAEIFRSGRTVQPGDGRAPRSALTVIYFLLRSAQQSRWHRVRSDEVWIWIAGAPLLLFEADAPGGSAGRIALGPLGEGSPVHVVPADRWQAARTTGEYTLVSCTVGPGFDFADFEMVDVALPD